jgi:threonine dehydrogenase-like Zn-dependent dehydrogenase
VIPLIASGQVQTSRLITHRFPLREVGAALDTLMTKRRETLKVMIEP